MRHNLVKDGCVSMKLYQVDAFASAPFKGNPLGKQVFTARQVSRRGGELSVEVRGGRVRIGGTAVTVFKPEPYTAASADSENVP